MLCTLQGGSLGLSPQHQICSVTFLPFEASGDEWIVRVTLVIGKHPTRWAGYPFRKKAQWWDSWVSILNTRKDSDAGRDWGQEKGTTEDEMAGWHH